LLDVIIYNVIQPKNKINGLYFREKQ